jgi:hypothetical protein
VIAELASGFRLRRLLANTLRALAVALPLAVLALRQDFGLPGVLGALALAVLTAGLLPARPVADPERIARHLDRVAPDLEESTGLLLSQSDDLVPLQQLQRERALAKLEGLDRGKALGPLVTWRNLSEVTAGALAATAILALGVGTETRDRLQESRRAAGENPAILLLDTVEVGISPPAYTRLAASRQAELDIEAIEGSQVSWRLAAPAGSRAVLRTGEGEEVVFERDGDSLALRLEADSSFVYRLVASQPGHPNQQTAFSRLKVIVDQAPVLSVTQPANRLNLIDPNLSAIELEVSARDDYGLGKGFLVATLAQGAGEMVEFRERRVALSVPIDSVETVLTHTLALGAMELGPAAELYLHVEVEDTRQPLANLGRSATTILRVPGSEAQTSDLSQGLPMILPPTYFRSQRQIIIDTEKLIAESPRLTDIEIRRRSEALGTDQRALRMRYGALLGEEFVSGQAVDPGDLEAGGDADLHDEQAEGPPSGADSTVFDLVPEDLTHAHDSTESATYFTSETRTQLKRVLAQMWDAEGRLRVIDPEGALPFELSALELLKDLQQRSRVYVQKVGFEAPPLEPATRRLTGELDEIPTLHRELGQAVAPEVVTAARILLSQLDPTTPLDLGGAADQATRLRLPIARMATTEVEALGALEALDLLLGGRQPDPQQTEQLATALWQLLPTPEVTPTAGVAANDPLTRSYHRQPEGGVPR